MDKLITKLQYVNFEPGEFADEKWRTKDELFELIETFPWEKQREHILIDYTNPGIVIQTDTNYLKLALYYNGKFVLYFFAGTHLYSKSFTNYKEAYPFITEYFGKGAIDSSIFKKENLLFKHVAVHFISKDFKYFVDNKRVKEFLLQSSLTSLIFLLIFFVMAILVLWKGAFIAFFAILIIMFLMGGGINLLLYFNYSRYTKNKMLIVSKGNDLWYYGDINSIKMYKKCEIENITITSSDFKSGIGRNFWEEFAVYTIVFSDSRCPISFTSLLISKEDFKNKFSRDIQTEKYKAFPFFTDLGKD